MAAKGILFDREAVTKAINATETKTEALEALGLVAHADNFRRIVDACIRFDLPVPQRREAKKVSEKSDEEISLAVSNSDMTFRSILDQLGMSSNNQLRAELEQRLLSLGLKTPSHRKRSLSAKWSKENLERIISGLPVSKRNKLNVLRAMGLSSAHKNYVKLESMLEQHGIPPVGTPIRSRNSDSIESGWRSDDALRKQILSIAPDYANSQVIAHHLIENYDGLDFSVQTVATFVKRLTEQNGVVIGSRYIDPRLSANSKISRATVKPLFSSLPGVNPELCSECGLESVWNGKPIVMHLDHIDGDTSHNDPSNLRFLCPNCHSQTETYCRLKFTS